MLEKTNKILVPNFVTPCHEPPSGVPHLTPAKKKLAIQNAGRGGVRRTSPSAFAILTNCSATNHRAVFLGSPLPKKILAIQNVGRGGVRRTSPSAFAILMNCSATNHRAVFLGSPLPKKYSLSETWAGVECERQASRRRGLSDYARKN